MSTDIRPELSKHSKYWIPKHRYYELKHFVMQFPYWKDQILATDSLVRSKLDKNGKLNDIPDPVGRAVELRTRYQHYIDICHDAAEKTDDKIGPSIWLAVIHGYSYETVKARLEIPCGREMYYELYRKFFWLLDNTRN